jgi:hypothetical protein
VTFTASLLLDEMHAPTIAEELSRRGHDVVAVAATPELRALTDDDLFRVAATAKRRIVSENVKDYRRLLHQAEEAGTPTAGCSSPAAAASPGTASTPGSSSKPSTPGFDDPTLPADPPKTG